MENRRRTHGGVMCVAWIATVWLGVMNCPAATVYLEDSPAAIEMLDNAMDRQAQGEIGEAAVILQALIEQYPDKLMPDPAHEGVFIDAIVRVRRLISADPGLLTAYRARYEPEAARILSSATQTASLDEPAFAEALHDVLRRYTLTESGLQAGLNLAALRLEKADISGAQLALSQLADHPSVEKEKARFHELLAITAMLSGEQDAVERELASLDSLGANSNETAARLRDMLSQLRVPSDPLNDAQAAELSPLISMQRPLWQVSLERVFAQEDHALLTGRKSNDTPDRLIPVAAEGALLVSNGSTVVALDQASGRLRWVYQDEKQAAVMGNPGLGRVLNEERAPLVMGGRVYAVLGEAGIMTRRRMGISATTRLVCLDLETGERLWQKEPVNLDPTLDRAAFHGTPLWCDGRVIAMAQRSQVSSFQDAYLIAADANDGSLMWRRHLSSAAGSNSRSRGSTSSRMTLHQNRIYFCDNIGVAAAIDARTGTVHWVRLLEGPAAETPARPTPGAVVSSTTVEPAVCDAGVILPLTLGQDRGLLLNRDTGELIRALNDRQEFRVASHILPIENDLLVVGHGVMRIDGHTLELVWSQSFEDAVTGRPAIAKDLVIVSRADKLMTWLDADTGTPTAPRALPVVGHAAALGQMLVLASQDSLAAYLPWDTAYASLLDDITQHPLDPGPGLSLAQLAINADQPRAVVEGVQRTITALNATDSPAAQRQSVIEELLRVTSGADALPDDSYKTIFDLIAAAARTPSELAAFQIALGEHLTSRDELAPAAAAYQSILADPRLASASFTQHGTTRRADIAARQALYQLMADHGRAFYQTYELQAAQRLAQLQNTPDASADRFIEITERYPLSAAAAQALIEAGNRLAQADTHRAAITHYRRAFRLADNDATRALAVGSLAAYYQQHNRPNDAARWLRLVQRSNPAIKPTRAGQPIDSDTWLAELNASDHHHADRPTLGATFAQPVLLDGIPLLPANAVDTSALVDPRLVVLRQNQPQTLTLHQLPQTSPRWTVKLPAPVTQQIDLNQDNLLLWLPQQQKLAALLTTNGQPAWPIIDAQSYLDQVGIAGSRAKARRSAAGSVIQIIEGNTSQPIRLPGRGAAPQPADPLASNQPPIVTTGDAIVCIIGHDGRVVGVDRFTGQPLWHQSLPLDVVNSAQIFDDLLTVTGKVSPTTDAQSAVFAVIELATGQPTFPAIEESQSYHWVGTNPDGHFITIADDLITLRDRADGRPLWRYERTQNNKPLNVYAGAQHLLLFNTEQRIAISTRTGQPVDNASLPATATLPTDTRTANGLTFLINPETVVCLGSDLQTLWRDAIANQPRQLLHMLLSQDTLAVISRERLPGQQTSYRLLTLEQDTGRIIRETSLPATYAPHPNLPPQILDRHLLLPTLHQSLLLPTK